MKRIHYTILSFFIFGAIFGSLATASSPAGFFDDELLSGLIVEIEGITLAPTANLKDKKSIVQAFCDAVENKNLSQDKTLSPSNQSVFLAVLCNHNGVNNDAFTASTFNYLKKDTDGALSSYRTLKFHPSCHKSYGGNCRLAKLTEEIMIQLFSELFTFKQAEIYGMGHNILTDQTALHKKIDSYVAEKFATPVQGEFGFCGDSEWTSYPKTCDMLKNTMKAFPPAFKKFKLLDPNVVYQAVANKQTSSDFKSCLGDSYDLVLCGTLGATNNGLHPFINLVYNELTRYLIFVTYYEWILNDKNDRDQKIDDELQYLLSSQEKLLFLTNQSIDDLSQIAVTYPIHVGLVMYQEDLLRFRNKLSRLVVPFYTLYYKLRNVQSNS